MSLWPWRLSCQANERCSTMFNISDVIGALVPNLIGGGVQTFAKVVALVCLDLNKGDVSSIARVNLTIS